MGCIMDKQKLILEGLKQDSINEASLGRLFQHIGKDFIVFITSDRQVLKRQGILRKRILLLSMVKMKRICSKCLNA